MTTVSQASGRRLDRILLPVLVALAEGAWLAVLDAAAAANDGTRPLGPLPFAIAAGAGLVVVRRAPDRRSYVVGLGATYVIAFLAAGLLGGGVPGTGLAGALAASSALLAGVAAFRGSCHVDGPDDDLVVGSLLNWGFVLVAAAWVFGTSLSGAAQSTFVATAFPSTLLFGIAGLGALGLARLDALTASSGVNWRSNRSWALLFAGILLVMAIVAVPAAYLLGTPISGLVAGLLGPLGILLSPLAWALGIAVEILFVLLQPIGEFIASLYRKFPQLSLFAPQTGTDLSKTFKPENGSPLLGPLVGLAIVVLVLLVVLRVVYARPTVRRPIDETTDEREFLFPRLRLGRPRIPLPSRPPRPRTASSAYLAFLWSLRGQPDLARQPTEGPATHAVRLRAAGFDDPGAARLAADYELERYGMRTLTPKETGRALGRWTRLRQVIGRRRVETDAPSSVTGDSQQSSEDR